VDIVFFAHPSFLNYRSMDDFSAMLSAGMRNRGHQVRVWAPARVFSRLPANRFVKKWLGYIDQYIIFPYYAKLQIKQCRPDTLFVFTDQTLGPWVNLINNKPHVIHCHDFLALRSALGEIPENYTGWTGRRYQAIIRRGYSLGENFISVSKKTREQLNRFLINPPRYSEVVYNGVKEIFKPCTPSVARKYVGKQTSLDLLSGYLMHIGGNQWYKNRTGVIEIYNAWRSISEIKLPLIMIGESASAKLLKTYDRSPYKADIHFFTKKNDEFVRYAYAGASVFLFPSLSEGFGWPIAEAMACGCLVITTDEAPMTEVAGNTGFLIPRRPYEISEAAKWAFKAAKVVDDLIKTPVFKQKELVEEAIRNAKRFDAINALDKMEAIYLNILHQNK
jgi:glycosyltransferase involved in cell wall biosynthesis